MKGKMLFTRNGGTPVRVSSIEDIKGSLGDMLHGFDDVEIEGNHVLARKGINYIQIGTIQNC